MTSFFKLQGCCPTGSWVDFLVEHVEIAAALYGHGAATTDWPKILVAVCL
jgi:hypothetical protein